MIYEGEELVGKRDRTRGEKYKHRKRRKMDVRKNKTENMVKKRGDEYKIKRTKKSKEN